jgi:SM-20-related protein
VLDEPKTASLAQEGDGQDHDATPCYECFDGILTEEDREAVDSFLQAPGWDFGWKSHSRSDVFSFWHKHFAGHKKAGEYSVTEGRWPPPDCSEELRQNYDIIFQFWDLLRATLLKGHSLVRCYANGMPFGSEGTLHTDSDSPTSYTAVYYPNRIWHPNWAGETLIFNKAEDDVVASIYPKPNRLLIFRGDTPHVARGVSRTCPSMRSTLMFKTEKTSA